MRAFLDTTILADAILKDRATRHRTITVLKAFKRVEFPAFALKELRCGPLATYRLLHNYLAEERSFLRALSRVHALSRTPRRNSASTIIEAWQRAEEDLFADPRRGARPNDQERADELRFHLQRLVLSADRRLEQLPGTPTFPLRCSVPSEIRVLPNGLLAQAAKPCNHGSCELAEYFRDMDVELELLIRAIESQPDIPEHTKRLKALHRLKADHRLDDPNCSALGDAVFVLLAPPNFVILTTNVKHHAILAEALGKVARAPYD